MKACVIVALLLMLTTVALAQGADAGAAAAPAPAATAKRGDGFLTAGRGYLKVGPESEALWKQLCQAQADLRIKEWEIFTLLSAGKVEKRTVAAKMAEARDLKKQSSDLRDKLKPFWVPLNPKAARGGKGAHQKRQQPAPAAAPVQ